MKSLKNLLLEFFELDTGDIERAETYQKRNSGRLEEILLNMGALTEEQLAELYSKQFNFGLFNPEINNAQILKLGTDEERSLFQGAGWFLLTVENGVHHFVTHNPLDMKMNNWVLKNTDNVAIQVSTESQLQALEARVDLDGNVGLELDSLEEAKLKELASEAPTVNYLNSLMARAVRSGASDMHVEPYQKRYRVRFRVDGVLHEVEKVPSNLQVAIITRLKIIAGMDIAEKRRPQDGKVETKIANQEVDIRVSALPLNDGESVVMRFLKKGNVSYDLSVLQLSQDVEECIKRDIKKTSGVILLTGPTGSGKTTTLYTFLNDLNKDDVKIITLEDPVEYQLAGINQVQVNSHIGFDFSAGLRSIVRQDPDVMMVGEIRDKETAQIALQSALTGHLVFSTVHTNDAPSAFTRLLDLGVDEYLLNAALVSIVAQRLARKNCPHCLVEDPEAASLIAKYKLVDVANTFGLTDITLKRGEGCSECSGTGYKGRMAITEYMPVDEEIKLLAKDESFLENARKIASKHRRRNLFEDGLYKAMKGQTTVDEILRVAG